MNITKKNLPEIVLLEIKDPILTLMQDMKNINKWRWMLPVTIVIVERERPFIPEKIKNKADQLVLKVN
jgi:hypothetical protein